MKSKNWLISIFALIIMVTIIAVTVVVTVNNKKTNLNEKIISEIDYLDKTMIAMVNKLNNLQTSDEIHAKRTSVEISSQNIMTDSSKSGEESSSNSNGSKMGGTDSSGSSNSKQGSGSTGDSSTSTEKYQIQNNAVLLRNTSDIDWNELQNQAENLYKSWTTITLDLNTMNVTSDDILAYSTNLDNLMVSLKEKNKVNSAICLANMYSLIPKYTNEISSDTAKSKLENVKSNIIFAYSIVETDRWDDILKLLGQAETDLTELMAMKENLSAIRKPKINKAYVLLKELIKSSNDKNVDIFYLKYINLIEELDNL